MCCKGDRICNRKTWEETLTGLYETALKYKSVPDDKSCFEKYLSSLGWVKQNQPRKSDNKRYRGAEYCTRLSVNGYIGNGQPIIANIGSHRIVAIAPTNEGDGINNRYKIHDTWDSSGGCIGNYWIKYDIDGGE